MKLSQAIRLGAILSPQGRGDLQTRRRKYFFGLIGPRVNATCALGAAFQAAKVRIIAIKLSEDRESRGGYRGQTGALKAGETIYEVQDPWPWTQRVSAVCPECGHYEEVYRLIPHLNDEHRWTRGQIAAFVENIEPLDWFHDDETLIRVEINGEPIKCSSVKFTEGVQ